MNLLDVGRVVVTYGARRAVDDVSFRLAVGEIGCLLGPSGCGKTTLLRAIAGFERIAGGRIDLDGRRVADDVTQVPPERRRVGMVFQDHALFPHLDVAGNVGFGLRALPARERSARVDELLDLVGLPGENHRFPHELSGGQQQRVALARALAPGPPLLLLDEPFSSLDVDLRERLSVEVRDILKRAGTTAVLVTHDQDEAFAMADEVGVMREGRIEQWATPYDLYHRPATRFVADFVGEGVLVSGRVTGPSEVHTEVGPLPANVPEQGAGGCDGCRGGCAVQVLLRPDDVIHDEAAALRAEVVSRAFRGAEFLYTVRLASGLQLLSLVPSHHDHAIGEWIGIRIETGPAVVFHDDGSSIDPT